MNVGSIQYVVICFLGQRTNGTLPRRIYAFADRFVTKLFNISPIWEIDRHLFSEALAIHQFGIIIFAVCGQNFSNSSIVGGFMEDLFGKELKPWQENVKVEKEQ